MKIKILDKLWNFRFVNKLKGNTGGDCDPPDTVNKTIRVVKGLSEYDELRLLLHEFLHAGDWTKDEDWVDNISSDIAHILIKIGWHKESFKKDL